MDRPFAWIRVHSRPISNHVHRRGNDPRRVQRAAEGRQEGQAYRSREGGRAARPGRGPYGVRAVPGAASSPSTTSFSSIPASRACSSRPSPPGGGGGRSQWRCGCCRCPRQPPMYSAVPAVQHAPTLSTASSPWKRRSPGTARVHEQAGFHLILGQHRQSIRQALSPRTDPCGDSPRVALPRGSPQPHAPAARPSRTPQVAPFRSKSARERRMHSHAGPRPHFPGACSTRSLQARKSGHCGESEPMRSITKGFWQTRLLGP